MPSVGQETLSDGYMQCVHGFVCHVAVGRRLMQVSPGGLRNDWRVALSNEVERFCIYS